MAIALEQTRVNFSPTSRVAFLRLHNSGEQPLFFTASIENNPCQSCPETSAAPHFVVTPASGVIAPHRPLQLRVVRTGNTLAADRETLASLALRIVPASQSLDMQGTARLQSVMLLHVKVFDRPSEVTTRINNRLALQSLQAQCQAKTLLLTNPSPVYLTLTAIRGAGPQRQSTTEVTSGATRAPLIAPFSTLSLPCAACPRELTVTALDESGTETLTRTLQLQASRP